MTLRSTRRRTSRQPLYPRLNPGHERRVGAATRSLKPRPPELQTRPTRTLGPVNSGTARNTLACPHMLHASPTHTHVPPGSDRPHGPPTPPPSRPGGSHARSPTNVSLPPPTRQSPHRCVMPLTDAPRAPPGVRHRIYVSHGVVPVPEWLRCSQLRVRCWKIDTAVYPW